VRTTDNLGYIIGHNGLSSDRPGPLPKASQFYMMVETQCLTDAAVALSNILSQVNIYHVFSVAGLLYWRGANVKLQTLIVFVTN